MKQGSNTRRGRSRGNGRRNPSQGNTIESNGPESKVRGTAHQVLDKYLAMAQDASSAGDRITAESYFQHAEHYYRLIHADRDNGAAAGQNRGGHGGRARQARNPAPVPVEPVNPPNVSEPTEAQARDAASKS